MTLCVCTHDALTEHGRVELSDGVHYPCAVIGCTCAEMWRVKLRWQEHGPHNRPAVGAIFPIDWPLWIDVDEATWANRRRLVIRYTRALDLIRDYHRSIP